MITTTSLETSKKLKEAGFRQDTSYFWYSGYDPKKNEWPTILGLNNEKYIHHSSGYASPTTDELLAELPFNVEGDKLRLIRGDDSKIWHVWYGNPSASFMHINLVEALAQMWLFLKAEGLLEVKK